MSISKESREILKIEVRKINEALQPLEAQLKTKTSQRDSLNEQIESLNLQIEKIKKQKKSFQDDIDAR